MEIHTEYGESWSMIENDLKYTQMVNPADWLGHATYPSLPLSPMKARSAPMKEKYSQVLRT
eukprot:10033589-Karenia_brevis.AAC.2